MAFLRSKGLVGAADDLEEQVKKEEEQEVRARPLHAQCKALLSEVQKVDDKVVRLRRKAQEVEAKQQKLREQCEEAATLLASTQ